ncbi:MAG: hypothetical protein NTV94_12405, partial [Planctomycetota bacterium]|nr:hypothetical protein [Planctomycetota bacterium]
MVDATDLGPQEFSLRFRAGEHQRQPESRSGFLVPASTVKDLASRRFDQVISIGQAGAGHGLELSKPGLFAFVH